MFGSTYVLNAAIEASSHTGVVVKCNRVVYATHEYRSIQVQILEYTRDIKYRLPPSKRLEGFRYLPL